MNQKPLWITARQLTKKTGLTKKDLFIIRKNNFDFWTTTKTGGYLYNAHQIPDILLIKKSA